MIEVFNCEQNSPEWDELRRGIVTASQFSTVMAHGRSGGPSVTRRKYMLQLASDRLGGKAADSYTNSHMERGHALEEEACKMYAFMRDAEPIPVGFVRNGDVGASPDRFIGDTGLLEIKTKLPALQLECLLDDKIPHEHIKQCQGQLWVTQRDYLDFVSYWPGLPIFIKRMERNERLIAEIKIATEQFNNELQQLVRQIGSM